MVVGRRYLSSTFVPSLQPLLGALPAEAVEQAQSALGEMAAAIHAEVVGQCVRGSRSVSWQWCSVGSTLA